MVQEKNAYLNWKVNKSTRIIKKMEQKKTEGKALNTEALNTARCK